MKDIKNKLTQITSKQLDLSEQDITEDARFREELGADSLDMTELVMALEDEFDIEITDSEISEVSTVGDAIQVIERKTK